MPEDTQDTIQVAERQDEAPSLSLSPSEDHEAAEADADESDAPAPEDKPADPPPAPTDPLSPPPAPAESDSHAAAAPAPEAVAIKTPAAPDGAVIVLHGSYVGPGCPDPDARKGADKGFGYDPAHPAKPGEIVQGLPEAKIAQMVGRAHWYSRPSFRRA